MLGAGEKNDPGSLDLDWLCCCCSTDFRLFHGHVNFSCSAHARPRDGHQQLDHAGPFEGFQCDVLVQQMHLFGTFRGPLPFRMAHALFGSCIFEDEPLSTPLFSISATLFKGIEDPGLSVHGVWRNVPP